MASSPDPASHRKQSKGQTVSWKQVVELFYPSPLLRMYYVPPLHFNKVPYRVCSVPGTTQPALLLSLPPSGQTSATPAPAGQASVPHSSASSAPLSGAYSQGGPHVSQTASPSVVSKRKRKKARYTQTRCNANTSSPASIPSSATVTSCVRMTTSSASNQPAAGSNWSGGCAGPDKPEPQSYNLWNDEPRPGVQPETFQHSDAQDDSAQRHVLGKLHALWEDRHEVMFVISQLKFEHYLSNPKEALAVACLPRPCGLEDKHRRGEFDLLLIHRHHGILIGEIKSVGMCHPGCRKTPPVTDQAVWKKIEKAISQLDKSEIVVKHVLSDLLPGLTVRKTLFLPYVSRDTLRRILKSRNQQLEQDLAQCLGVSSGSDVVDLCCCSDEIYDPANHSPGHGTPDLLTPLSTWWTRTFTCSTDPLLNDHLYVEILARFVGPATSVHVHCNIPPRVEVRTEGEAVAELGRRLARLVVTRQQLDLVNQAQPLVCITGPPGTGKTIVLVLMGLRWLHQGEDVDILSPYFESRAASYLIQYQLNETLKANSVDASKTGKVHLRNYDFNSGETEAYRAANELCAEGSKRQLNIILDEAGYGNKSARRALCQLIEKLTTKCPDLRLWACRVDRSELSPLLHTESLTLPLRCAPVIVREVQPAFTQLTHLENYSDTMLPSPADGLRVITLRHQGEGHIVMWPVECCECGSIIADELTRLGVGRGAITANSPHPLSYRDVFILTRCSKLRDDVKDDTGTATSPACGLVRGLRAAGFPLLVLGQKDKGRDVARWERDVADVATAASDVVTVAHVSAVFGLERKLVVWLPGRDDEFDDDDRSQERIEAGDRLVIVSRSTTHLIRVVK
ncbi:uncharacterized protein [Littorina saxatilis]|uniref:uncharacterized protein isoform X2 n=1 Tax=Littorina saxatilis TaxID=31220 RepID=UPI0038B4E23B